MIRDLASHNVVAVIGAGPVSRTTPDGLSAIAGADALVEADAQRLIIPRGAMAADCAQDGGRQVKNKRGQNEMLHVVNGCRVRMIRFND